MGSEEERELFDRLRRVEIEQAAVQQCLDNIGKTIDEVKVQLQSFLSEAAKRFELELTLRQIRSDVESLQIWREKHVNEFVVLKSEHSVCFESRDKERSWWKGIAGRIVEWAAVGLIFFLLSLWKGH